MGSLLRLAVISLSLSLIVGCTDPKIDTSSRPAAVLSIEKVRNSLPSYKRIDFDQALIVLASATTFNGINILNPERMNVAEIAESANEKMHGLTGDQIIHRADEILREQRSHEREQAIRTLKRLEEKQANANREKQHLALFTIDRAQYYMDESPYGVPEPVIDLEVTNGTDQAISELVLRGIVRSPDQPTPWVDETFYYVLPDGIAPGETLAWSLAPNRFGPWGEPRIPDDAELTLELKGLRGMNKQPLWDAPALTDNERETLERLRAEYGGVSFSGVE